MKVKVRELGPRSRKVKTVVKIVKKISEKDVISKIDGLKHKIAEFLVGDNSGCIIMSLWDDLIDKIDEGSVYEIENCYIHIFNKSMRLNLGRMTSMRPIEKEISVDMDNNLSNKSVEIPGARPSFNWNRPF
jgi:replication factor A1